MNVILFNRNSYSDTDSHWQHRLSLNKQCQVGDMQLDTGDYDRKLTGQSKDMAAVEVFS